MSSQNPFVRFNVLVVDDDLTCLNVVSSMLRTWKYEVLAMNSPIDALAAVKTQDIDLVMTDLHMPQMNGLELQRQINKEYKLPVIIMSSDDQENMILNVLASGAVFYLQKPVDHDDLKNIWQYAVAAKKEKSLRNIERIRTVQVGSSNCENNLAPSSNQNEAVKLGKRKSNKRGKEDAKDKNPVAPKKPKVVWTNSLHNCFLHAIRFLTLERAVPKKILEFMNVPGLTRENVASHLQKYRLFLKRVAEKGFGATAKNSMAIDPALRSCFAAGQASMMFKSTTREPYSMFKEGLQNQASASTAPFQPVKPASFGSMGDLSGGNSSLSRFGFGESLLLGGSTQANTVHRPIYGGTNPLYQPNRTGFGLGSNAIGTNTMQMPQHYNNMGAPSFAGTSRIWNPSHGTQGNNNVSTGDVSFSDPNLNLYTFNNNNYAGNQINNDGLNAASFGLVNGAANHQNPGGLGVGAVGDSTFGTCFAPGETSSAGFNRGNFQFPAPFSGVNEQGSTPAGPPSTAALQDFGGLSTEEQNDFMFDLMMMMTDTNDVFKELSDILTEPINYQILQHQQQVSGEGAMNPNFSAAMNPNFAAAMNPPTSQPSTDLDFSDSFNVENNRPWNEPSLEQLEQTQELENANLDNNAANPPSDDYHPMLEENPNLQQGDDDYLISELNTMFPADDVLQGWDDDFINSLLDFDDSSF